MRTGLSLDDTLGRGLLERLERDGMIPASLNECSEKMGGCFWAVFTVLRRVSDSSGRTGVASIRSLAALIWFL